MRYYYKLENFYFLDSYYFHCYIGCVVTAVVSIVFCSICKVKMYFNFRNNKCQEINQLLISTYEYCHSTWIRNISFGYNTSFWETWWILQRRSYFSTEYNPTSVLQYLKKFWLRPSVTNLKLINENNDQILIWNCFTNLDNSCYMNNVIQCLSNKNWLLDYLIKKSYIGDTHSSISIMKDASIKAFEELWSENSSDRLVTIVSFINHI